LFTAKVGQLRKLEKMYLLGAIRSVKYEKIYLNPPQDGLELFLSLEEYFQYYNQERRHESIQYYRPIDVYKKAA
jgi:putative transposase